jgi:putative hydrolase of the HAD superfamily
MRVPITTLFLDIGGVFLTNGWDYYARRRAQFRRFMCGQSKPYAEMLGLVAKLKARYRLKIAVDSNESLELNAYRVRTFKLDKLVDSFISSCFVHLRKPDANIFRLALDITQAPGRQVLYLESTTMFVQIPDRHGERKGLIHENQHTYFSYS